MTLPPINFFPFPLNPYRFLYSTMSFVDHYLVLGLPTGEDGVRLTEPQITKAFKARALEVHPDKRPPHEAFRAHADFQKLNQSYQILVDVQARREFDASLLNRLGLRRLPPRKRRTRRRPRGQQQQQQEQKQNYQRAGGQQNFAAGIKRRNMADFEIRDWKRQRAAEVEEECEKFSAKMEEIFCVVLQKMKKAAGLKAKWAAPGTVQANKPPVGNRNRGRGRAKGNKYNNVSRAVRISNQNPRKPPSAAGGVRIAQVAFRGIKKVAQPQMPMNEVEIQKPSSSLDSPMTAADRLPELFERLQIQPMQVYDMGEGIPY